MRHLQSQSFNRKKRVRSWIGGISLIISIFSFIFIASFCLHSDLLTIHDVTVFGADTDIAGEIHDLVMKKLDGNYAGIFPRANSFMYPKQDIVSSIKTKFPRVLDVNISRDDLSNLRVTVNQKIPAAIVCMTLPNFKNNVLALDPTDPCYFTDQNGVLLKRLPASYNDQYHVYYAPQISNSSSTDFTGALATSTSEFTGLENFYDGALATGISVDGILIKDAGEYELYASSTVIYFNDKEDLSNEITNLSAFWRHMTTPNNTKKPVIFDYIDLRYGPNVFYKII